MPTKTIRKRVRKTKESPYVATLRVLGQNHSAEGKNVREAIENLRVKNGRSGGLLTISKGGLRKEKILSRFLASRLFGEARIAREMALKNVVALFDI